MTETIRIVEVGPRDGLQNQSTPLSLEDRKTYIRALLSAGVREVEVGAFVRADKVPQMADSENVLEGVALGTARAYFLVPNQKGLERALASGAKDVAAFLAATDGFSKANQNSTMEAASNQMKTWVPAAIRAGLRVRGYLSVVWGCPYEKDVDQSAIDRQVDALLGAGCFEVSLGDTIGVGNPFEVRRQLEHLGKRVGLDRLAVHFHDTWGLGIANVLAAVDLGIRVVDASSGGLGGCPYAPGASGNVATEDVIRLVEGLGFATGIHPGRLADASLGVLNALGGLTPASKALQAEVARRNRLR